jgi:hypothetical protein
MLGIARPIPIMMIFIPLKPGFVTFGPGHVRTAPGRKSSVSGPQTRKPMHAIGTSMTLCCLSARPFRSTCCY